MYQSYNLLASLIVLGELLMRYESFCRYRPTFFKIALNPPLAEPYRILLKSPYLPANNSDIIVMHFFKVLILIKSFLTHLGQIICMDFHEKPVRKSEARFFAQVVPPDYLMVIFFNYIE